ncbi:VWA domain-containing protein [Halobacteriovorax sp. GB3]|uniref:VWA domain-containing protein n=1 Tax=Halobacteriovorax sp. GB3 TaxID=2719615 RepID=UPI002360DBBE|nr:VWA domain-containing protein [Halobacteriovorax sp. GB3]MDD0854615.1 VWA domain-containing protein [Halobacteriovorax sp. GB3]
MIAGLQLKEPMFLIFGIVGFIFWLISLLKPFKKPELRLPNKYLRSGNFFKTWTVILLAFFAWIALGISGTIPRKPAGFAKNNTEVNDIFFVVDVSRSMLAEDFQPNRLEAAKKKIYEFIKMVPTDRIGIIMFSERAFTLLPLTTDLKLIERVIDEIRIGGLLGGGTNIGDALALAVARGAKSLTNKKTIILLTDGVSQVGYMTPLQAAEEAKNQGIKVYTIGIGGSEDAQMPISNTFGIKRYQKIPGGSVDFETLQKIAEITGGKDFIAGNSEALREVLAEIEKLERKKIEISAKIIYSYHHYQFLIFGSVLLVIVEILRRYWLKEAE